MKHNEYVDLVGWVQAAANSEKYNPAMVNGKLTLCSTWVSLARAASSDLGFRVTPPQVTSACKKAGILLRRPAHKPGRAVRQGPSRLLAIVLKEMLEGLEEGLGEAILSPERRTLLSNLANGKGREDADDTASS